jgi:hypothetical protein
LETIALPTSDVIRTLSHSIWWAAARRRSRAQQAAQCAVLPDRVDGNAIQTVDKHSDGHDQDGDTRRHRFEALTDGKKENTDGQEDAVRDIIVANLVGGFTLRE